MAFIDTTDIEDAYSMVAPYVQGAPFATIIYYLREAAIDFCTKTLCWRATLAPVLTVVDRGEYDLKLPDQSKLVKLLRYKFDDREQTEGVVSPDQGAALLDQTSSADAIWTENRVTFKVCPVPTVAAKEMVLTVALKPSSDSTCIPSNIFEDFATAIAEGAIGRIAAIPRQAFSDMQQASLYQGKFQDEIDRVAAAVSAGFGRSTKRVRPFLY